MTGHPCVVVGALICNENNEIFLGKSVKWAPKWIVPGGHLEYGEKLVDCVKREVKEETNLYVDTVELVGVQECIMPDVEHYKKKHMIFLDYSCKLVGGEVKLNDEFQEFKWFSPESALELDLNDSTRTFIKAFIDKNII